MWSFCLSINHTLINLYIYSASYCLCPFLGLLNPIVRRQIEKQQRDVKTSGILMTWYFSKEHLNYMDTKRSQRQLNTLKLYSFVVNWKVLKKCTALYANLIKMMYSICKNVRLILMSVWTPKNTEFNTINYWLKYQPCYIIFLKLKEFPVES